MSGRSGPRLAAHFPASSARGVGTTPPAGRNLANGWPQCRCRKQKTCQQGLDLLVSVPAGSPGLYRISDDKGQLPEGASFEGHSLDLALGWFCCNLVSSVERQIALLWHWNWISSYSLPTALLHASSIFARTTLRNNVAEVFTPPNASVSPESRFLSSLVTSCARLVLSAVAVLLLCSVCLSLLLPIRQRCIPNPGQWPKSRRSQPVSTTEYQNRQRMAVSCLPPASTPSRSAPDLAPIPPLSLATCAWRGSMLSRSQSGSPPDGRSVARILPC